jgi:hypothetical protein
MSATGGGEAIDGVAAGVAGPHGGSTAGGAGDVERLLHRALAPIEPPEDLAARLRGRLESIRAGAAEELEGWELAAMRDPRNWVRPAAAAVGGAAAGAGLLLLGRQQRQRQRARTLIVRVQAAAAELLRRFVQRH